MKEAANIISRESGTVLLAGNPNVGKSTVFNALTGMHQHTGNWTGKTVASSKGSYSFKNTDYTVIDLPGTYSLYPHSFEEQVARNCVCFSDYDVTVVVCDATTLERCLSLVLQVLEVTNKVVVCVNLIDEAEKKHISIDFELLSHELGVPVTVTSARNGKGLDELQKRIDEVKRTERPFNPPVHYSEKIENMLQQLKVPEKCDSRQLRLRILCADEDFISKANEHYGTDCDLNESIDAAKSLLDGENQQDISDEIASALIKRGSEIARKVTISQSRDDSLDRRLDKIFTGKLTGIPVMLLLLALVFFITIYAANYPSALLSRLLFSLGEKIRSGLIYVGLPWWITEPLIDGVWRVMAWVISVMLPPMAIFFPLFTLLEDFGYLPRVAFNLDHCFKKCCACGKQSLCMCMGFGCNAAGVVGCRIIDSPRERLVAVLTNSLVPCNGRFPTIIAVISMFFVSALSPTVQTGTAALILTSVILLSVCVTLLTSFVLSKTLLKGQPSSFTLELPSYRMPKIGSVIIRSVFDRTLFVLARAVAVAAPMGLVIWLLANIKIGGESVMSYACDLLSPVGRLMGLDGAILLGFILGFPANEIVLPLALMCYLSNGSLVDIADNASVYAILSANGWTAVTGICYILFSLFHFPCSTTLMTIKKETGSLKYTVLSAVIPTAIGFVLCVLVNLAAKLF